MENHSNSKDTSTDVSIRFSEIKKKFSDLFEFVNDLQDSVRSERARALISSVLDLLRPLHISWGLRISRLSSTHIEFVLPINSRTLSLDKEIDLGVLTSAAAISAHLFLRRMDLRGLGNIELRKIEIEKLSALRSELRGRIEVSPLQQETLRLELNKEGKAELDLECFLFNSFDQIMAQGKLNFSCRQDATIDWKREAQ